MYEYSKYRTTTNIIITFSYLLEIVQIASSRTYASIGNIHVPYWIFQT